MNINLEMISKALAENCMTWKDLSAISGVSTVTLARINKGVQEPQPITVGRICRALNLSIDQIIKTEEK